MKEVVSSRPRLDLYRKILPLKSSSTYSRGTVCCIGQSSLSATNQCTRFSTYVTVLVERTAQFPVSRERIKSVILDRLIFLVGNWANYIDYLADNSVNLGYGHIRMVDKCIETAASFGRVTGSEQGVGVRRYEFYWISANLLAVSRLTALQAAFFLTGSARYVWRPVQTTVKLFCQLKKGFLWLTC